MKFNLQGKVGRDLIHKYEVLRSIYCHSYK
jgi:hypothetical protein